MGERTGPVREVVGEGLTSWTVSPCGRRVQLSFEDGRGQRCRLDLPVEAASALLMTLPRILRAALRARGDHTARVVQPLGAWRVEQAADTGNLVLTLATPTGFDMAFAVAPDQLEAMGEAVAEIKPAARRLN